MVLTKFLKLNELDTSTSTATPPAACATFIAFSICISATITLAPSLANFLTIPDPKPDPPPDTMAILLLNLIIIYSPPYSCIAAIVFKVENPYKASNPFSRPWPE